MAGRGAGGAGALRGIPPHSAPGGCEAARESRWTLHVNDALQDGIVRILSTAVSVWRRRGLGMAGPFAAMYETRHGLAPRMRFSCWSIDVPRWTACSLLWRLHVVHEFVFLKASVGTLREHCARLEGCFGACERFQKSF